MSDASWSSPTTQHDTDSTTAQISKHLGFLNPNCETHPAEDNDSLRDGNPVAMVEVNNMLMVYPVEGTETVGIARRELAVTRWAIDTLVDDSDPSVGMYGCEPVEHSLHNSLPEALTEIASLLAAEQVGRSLEAEMEDQLEADLIEAESLANEDDLARECMDTHAAMVASR